MPRASTKNLADPKTSGKEILDELTPHLTTIREGMDDICCPYYVRSMPEEARRKWIDAFNSEWSATGDLDDAARITNACSVADDAIRELGFVQVHGSWMQEDRVVQERLEDDEVQGGVRESLEASGGRIDPEKGIIKGAVIFDGDQENGIIISDSGTRYAHEFFTKENLAALDGAICFDKHSAKFEDERPLREGIGAWTNIRSKSRAHPLPVLGDLELFSDTKESYASRIDKLKAHIGFSMFGRTKVRKQDGATVHVSFAGTKKKPTVDLVDVPGGTQKGVFERLHDQPPQPAEKERPIMTLKELREKHAALVKQAEDEAINATVRESLKESAALVKESIKSLEVQERKTAIREAMVTVVVADEDMTGALRSYLETCPEDKIVETLRDHKKLLGRKEPSPVRGQGADGGAGGTANASETQIKERLVVTVEHEGFGRLCETLSDGKQGAERGARINERFIREVIPQIELEVIRKDRGQNITPEYQAKKDKFDRLMSQYSVREIFEGCTGLRPRSGVVREAAVSSTAFQTINRALLASQVIAAYNETLADLIGDELVTIYPSRKEIETFAGFTFPDGFAATAEGATYPTVVIGQKYTSTVTFSKSGVLVQITEEEVLFDQTGQILNRANAVGNGLAIAREKDIIDGVRDSATTTWYPSGVATSLYSAGNLNLITNNPVNDTTALEAVENKLAAFLTDAATTTQPIYSNADLPFEILHSRADHPNFRRVLRATYSGTRTTTGNVQLVADISANPYSDSKLLPTPLLARLSAGGAYFVSGKGGFKKQFRAVTHFPFEVVPLPPSEVLAISADIVAGVRARYKMKVFAVDKVYVVKCTG